MTKPNIAAQAARIIEENYGGTHFTARQLAEAGGLPRHAVSAFCSDGVARGWLSCTTKNYKTGFIYKALPEMANVKRRHTGSNGRVSGPRWKEGTGVSDWPERPKASQPILQKQTLSSELLLEFAIQAERSALDRQALWSLVELILQELKCS